MNVEKLLSLALWLAGGGHFVILIASFQVPFRLGWKEDLAKLIPFNRKLMWTYGGFTVLMIVAFGTLLLALHDELMRGDRAALAIAGLIGLFWTLRLLVDAFCFGHVDWPKGRGFAVGHALLVLLFVALAGTCWALLIWHGWFR